MNLEDVIDPEAVNSVHALQQDEWSLTKPTFGEEGQLEVVGWSGKCRYHKYYVLKCSKCSQDAELFGEGYFRSEKRGLVRRDQIPCGCSKGVKWSEAQMTVRCSRKAEELGYTFLGFAGEWKGVYTKIKMSCEKHGEWSSGVINNLISNSAGCQECGLGVMADTARKANIKPDEVMIKSFLASGAFHLDTKFWRSERKNNKGYTDSYWYVSCQDCGQVGESRSNNLQLGKLPCDCSPMRQQECYINCLMDDNNMAVAIKFGITNNSKRRIKEQSSTCAYTLKQHAVYTFPSVQQCKQAERECKKELETGVVLKRDMPDGWTETTWSYNIGKVIDIYKRNGGVLV